MKTKLKSLWYALLGGVLLPTLTVAQNKTTDAITLMSMGRFDEAKQVLSQAAQSSPSMQTYFDAGYGYLRAGQPDSARIWFEKGVSMDEKRVPLNKTGVAISYLAQNNTAQAEPMLNEVVSRSKGKNATILYRIGEAYTGYLTSLEGSFKPRYQMPNPTKAIDFLNRAVARDGKNPNIQLALGDAHYLNKDAGTAMSRYESALEAGMEPAWVYQRMGDIYWQGRNLNLAVENYKKAIEANPQYAPAYRQLAELYYLVNKYKDAASYTDQYMQVANDKRPDMLLRSAQFHFLGNNYQKAVDVINANRGALGQNPIIHRIEGWAYSSLKQPEKAIESLNTFLQKAPEKAMSDDYKYLGKAYLTTESAEDDSLGVVFLQKAAPADTAENLYSDIAKYYYRTKKHVQAVAALDSGMALKPTCRICSATA